MIAALILGSWVLVMLIDLCFGFLLGLVISLYCLLLGCWVVIIVRGDGASFRFGFFGI